ncbi:MAG: Holliday junction DNA helicase RuvB [Candidatus Komeilibacteria bacterium RIFCSPLOWO2_01_FULL_53_11]|uniref:Holliday junction branch migration complex subunit RuvB n=1 Tax=Candidatus Komeilibacteria bacterium RIFCSPLOWO2_01_FULL_53_11 TaxID=1798552 RepID=A0A1G2BXN6_9BACT|nr:MAG: Holliday junction DNA helicase RuvB [Candidatus Komeilibacteria bacterium RIFCSPLOWO2_01_FULL_53_11]
MADVTQNAQTDDKQLLNARELKEDKTLDLTLRPRTLDEYIGQQRVKENLKIFLKAAQQRKEPIEHVLIYGPPGLGKTTLAHIIAREMQSNIRVTSGTTITKTGDLAALLTNLQEGDILFIDEIHRLPKMIEEVLYPAMEDFVLDIILGKGPSAQIVRLNLPRFTIIGATTRYNLLSSPLRDRFGVTYRLDFYRKDDISEIVRRSARLLSLAIDDDASLEISKRSRATPRVANRILKRVRDFSQVKGDGGKITVGQVQRALEMLAVDHVGLEELDRKLLKAIVENFGGGPVGLNTVAAIVQEDAGTIEEVYEPYLMQVGFLARTSRGRVVTERGYEHLGLEAPGDISNKLL